MNLGDAFLNLTGISDYLNKTFNIDCTEITFAVQYSLQIVKDLVSQLIVALSFLPNPFVFTEFQLLIFYTFLFILILNICLIFYLWYKYGDEITDRFVRPSKYGV